LDPKDRPPLILPLWVKRLAFRKLAEEGLSSDLAEGYLNEYSRSMGFNGVTYSYPMPVSVGHRITRLRQRLPSLPVDLGSYKNSVIGKSERWLRLGTLRAKAYWVLLESQSFELVPGGQPRTSLKFELSVPFTRQQLSDKLTCFRRSLLTLLRRLCLHLLGVNPDTQVMSFLGMRKGRSSNSLDELTWKRSQ
jgi:CRP-like cAMP-binding protein